MRRRLPALLFTLAGCASPATGPDAAPPNPDAPVSPDATSASPDAGAPPDAAPVPAPVVQVFTPSPGAALQARFTVAGAAGARIQVFASADCSGAPIAQDTAEALASSGVEVTVGAGQTVRLTARQRDAAGTDSPCSRPARYVHDAGGYQRLTFGDEFKGPGPDDDPACFAMAPQCAGEYQSTVHLCPGDQPQLAALDKCAWTVLHQNNWMAMGPTPTQNGVNAFVPGEVAVLPAVDDGVLVLSASGYAPDGSVLTPGGDTASWAALFGQPMATWLASYDCRWSGNTTNCPFRSGAVYAKRQPAAGAPASPLTRGFTQAYGRWEVRAKLPSGPGSFPAHWLLPQSGAWPEAGEIDIMEAGRAGDLVYQTFHTGYCDHGDDPYELDPAACRSGGGQRLKLSKGALVKAKAASTYTAEYRTYAVDWSPDRLTWSIDGVVTVDIPAGQLTYSNLSDHGLKWRGAARPVSIPEREFFLILNQTVHEDGGPLNPYGFVPQQQVIDYVRVYATCAAPSEFCPAGAAFDGDDGLCHPLDGSAPAPSACSPRPALQPAGSLDATRFGTCTDPCPYGGWFSGSSCEIMTVPAGDAWFFTTGDGVRRMYWTDPSASCTAPLDGPSAPAVQVGDYDGANCHLDPTRPGVTYAASGPGFRYAPVCTHP